MILKEKLKDYLKDKYDVTLELIFEDLKLEAKDLLMLEVYMEELVNDKWIKKSMTGSGYYEYDPGEKLNYGGLQG